MLALFKEEPGPGLALVERPEPVVGPGEVKIRVLRTGICGTDLHILRWDPWAAGAIRTPLVPGHEFFGEIVEVAPGVPDVAVGDKVSGEGHIVCGTCRNCRAGRRQMCIRTVGVGLQRDGAFAQYVTLPAENVWVHHDQVSPEVGAIFDPLGNAVHTALAFPVVGEDVLVSGCGPIGLMSVAVARHAGARLVVATDLSAPRLDMALRMGADHAVDVSSENLHEVQHTLGMREGFDVAFEMSGAASALPLVIDNMNHGGRIAMLGLPGEPFAIDWSTVVLRMLTLKGIYGREMFETWNSMSAMLHTSEVLRERIASLVTHRFGVTQWQDAFDAAASGGVGKVVIDWEQV
ncbi:L-threonine 3-dehydrogenase [Cellulomonas massiliensis]|uniref:L-threonine 3-dehydrogenase n=1 Tax=Cellulomonas massiliensis TaxID=1465811 RepID=UPI0002EBA6DE|nr:L-threonine 3-dehydrogenase [Cellulomonas massiliensis]